MTMFNWDPKFNFTNNLNMTKEAVLYHGKFCQSGMASRFSPTDAACWSIDQLGLSSDSTSKSTYADKAVSCKISSTQI